MIPRGRETLDRIQGHKLRDNAEPTTIDMVIRVLAYIGYKWIVDPNRTKAQPKWHICAHENHDYVRSSRTLCNGHGTIFMQAKDANSILFFQFMTIFNCHILTTEIDRELVVAKIWHIYLVGVGWPQLVSFLYLDVENNNDIAQTKNEKQKICLAETSDARHVFQM